MKPSLKAATLTLLLVLVGVGTTVAAGQAHPAVRPTAFRVENVLLLSLGFKIQIKIEHVL